MASARLFSQTSKVFAAGASSRSVRSLGWTKGRTITTNGAHDAAFLQGGSVMYYGTIAKYTVKPGHETQFMGDMERFEESPPAGWIYHTIFRSTTNPNEIWMSVVFENEAAYKKNADSPEMDKEYHRMLEHLEGEPEWHDGNVIHEAMRKSAPA